MRPGLFAHIRAHAEEKGIYLDFINGHWEHVHTLVALEPAQTIAGVVQILKGESSFWINKHKLTSTKFAWQDEYFALSVSASHIDRVRDYIRNQEEHHRRKSFQEEYQNLIAKYGFAVTRS